jgi:hypothetical protein
MSVVTSGSRREERKKATPWWRPRRRLYIPASLSDCYKVKAPRGQLSKRGDARENGRRAGLLSPGREESVSGEFETCPSWGPGVDRCWPSTAIILKTLGVDWFDQSASWPAKVRNVSRLGSQINIFEKIVACCRQWCRSASALSLLLSLLSPFSLGTVAHGRDLATHLRAAMIRRSRPEFRWGFEPPIWFLSKPPDQLPEQEGIA